MKLTIEVDVTGRREPLDPTLVDPVNVAEALLDSEDPFPTYSYTLVGAEWA